MKRLDFYVWLRKEIILLIDEIRDAAASGWVEAPQNWDNHRRVLVLFWKLADSLREAEVTILYRHSDCGRSRHPASGYAFEDNHLAIRSVDDTRYRMRRLFPISDARPCPCGKRTRYDAHDVHAVAAFPLGDLDASQQRLVEIVRLLGGAVKLSEPSRPRAAVREALLRSLILVNDNIMPQTVDEFVARQLEQSNDI